MMYRKIQTIALIQIPENVYFHLPATVIILPHFHLLALKSELSNFCKNVFSGSEESIVNGEY